MTEVSLPVHLLPRLLFAHLPDTSQELLSSHCPRAAVPSQGAPITALMLKTFLMFYYKSEETQDNIFTWGISPNTWTTENSMSHIL